MIYMNWVNHRTIRNCASVMINVWEIHPRECLHGSLYAIAHDNTTTGSTHFKTTENKIIFPRRGSTGNSAKRRPKKYKVVFVI